MAQERHEAPRAAASGGSSARPTRSAGSSRTGTHADRRPGDSGVRSGQVRRDAEHRGDARTVTERRADAGTRVGQPPGERRRRPASPETRPTGGTPKVSRAATASRRPAPAHNAGRADGTTRDSGRPQPQSRPGARGTGTARQSRGIGAILLAALRRARAALRGPVARVKRAVRRMIRRLSSRLPSSLRDLVRNGGGVQRAALAALQAVLAGRNPVLAAIKAWFAALSTPMKILVIVGLVLLALLAPLLLLALAIAVVVIAVRAPATV
jgi:hypothetical protein